VEIELSMVEKRRTPETLFWTNMSAENIIAELMATPRGAGIDRIRAFMEQIISMKMVYENIKESLRMDHLLETRLDAQLSRLKRYRKRYSMLNSRLFWRLLN
jgi:hypothetical protein